MGCIRLSPALLYRPDGGRHHDLNCGRLPYPRCEIVTEPGQTRAAQSCAIRHRRKTGIARDRINTVLVIDQPVGTAIGGRFRAAGIRSLGAEEYEPDDTQDQNGKAGGNRQ
jgi:hypothetical protein